MKKAEILMASFWAALCVAIILEVRFIPATRQPVGWEKGLGPEAGWFPYWLAVMMLICSLIVLIPKVIQGVKEGLKEDKAFVSVEGFLAIMRALLPMVIYVVTLPWLGFYLGSTLYLVYYLRAVGKHSWTLSLLTGTIFSVSIFLIFENALKLTLAKGFIEPILNQFL